MYTEYQNYVLEVLIAAYAAEKQGKKYAVTMAVTHLVLEGRDPQLKLLLSAAAIPHWFNREIITALLPTEQISDVVWDALINLPMVETFKGRGWNVHESTRLAIRHTMQVEEPQLMRELSINASRYFTLDDESDVESLYHFLTVYPERKEVLVNEASQQYKKSGELYKLDRLALNLKELDL